MKKFLISLLCMTLILSMVACQKSKPDETVNTQDSTSAGPETTENAEESTKITLESSGNISEEFGMKLFIGNVEVPVIWENNESVAEIKKDASEKDIVISMSMYSDFEQVGSLGKKYKSDDKQTTTDNGDIVLYNSSNLVVFYGSNSWAYTRLGKIDLPKQDVIDLLSKEDVTIRISAKQSN